MADWRWEEAKGARNGPGRNGQGLVSLVAWPLAVRRSNLNTDVRQSWDYLVAERKTPGLGGDESGPVKRIAMDRNGKGQGEKNAAGFGIRKNPANTMSEHRQKRRTSVEDAREARGLGSNTGSHDRSVREGTGKKLGRQQKKEGGGRKDRRD